MSEEALPGGKGFFGWEGNLYVWCIMALNMMLSWVLSMVENFWDMHEIERAVKILADDFLRMEVEKVEFLEMPTYEETKVSYERDYAPYAG
ncbi:hypothetical protein [Paenibacillus sp. DMB5]|uniref:hypothetical protein n=1 Tax=Paenibacillus sp. DMB5 TaxID=1780103 RepID=UPI00076CB9DA|nr:hypothetical protein [Paenibacillus sp. DMB5]KUP24878.1 hypothetical protein AWJ19_04760 [Paenibacillus sp. DMB5]